MSLPIEDVREEVRDIKFAKEYGAELAKINVAITLAKAREEKGLTQGQLAQKAGSSQPYIAKLESGNANPSIGTIGQILAVLGFRLVPEKDSLIPEATPSNKINIKLLPEPIIMSLGMTLFMGTASGLNPNPGVILWQENPNLFGNKLPSPSVFKTPGEPLSLVAAGCNGVTANNEYAELAGN
jgi:transcriptional regulator with XRE-family HTH domain